MKIIIVLTLMFSSFFVKAIELPVHHQYINYYFQRSGDVWNADIHLTWNKDPDVSYNQMGYYAMYSFYYENGAGGYLGLQKDEADGKKAIFSIWDLGSSQTAFPAMSHCRRFGHEGSGTQCIIKFDWKVNHEYKLRVWKIAESASGQHWGAWIIDYTSGEEVQIGIIETLGSEGFRGYGSLEGNSIAAIENYQTHSKKIFGCNEIKDFSVSWYGPFLNNNSFSSSDANVNYDTAVGSPCQENNKAFSSSPWMVTSETGAAVNRLTSESRDLWGQHNTEFLKQIDCVFNWAEAVAPNEFNQSSHRQKRLSKSFFNYYYRDYKSGNSGYALIVDRISNTTFLGSNFGTMEQVGSFNNWYITSGCNSMR